MSDETKKVLPFPAAPAPAPEPTAAEKAVIDAKAVLVTEQTARAQACMIEIQAALAKHRCQVTSQCVIHFDGRAPTMMWDIGALP